MWRLSTSAPSSQPRRVLLLCALVTDRVHDPVHPDKPAAPPRPKWRGRTGIAGALKERLAFGASRPLDAVGDGPFNRLECPPTSLAKSSQRSSDGQSARVDASFRGSEL